MNSLFVVTMGFGLTILAVASAYLVHLKRHNNKDKQVNS